MGKKFEVQKNAVLYSRRRKSTCELLQHPYLFKDTFSDPQHCGTIGVLLGKEFDAFQQRFPDVPPNKPACVYTPKVQLLDNWGWCNATFDSLNIPSGCSNFGLKYGKGCYVDEKDNECDINDKNNFKVWTPFGGKIIVLSTKE